MVPPEDRNFERRFRQREDELRWLYMELYRENRQAYDYFVSVLQKRFFQRPQRLKRKDVEKMGKGFPRFFAPGMEAGKEMPNLSDDQLRLLSQSGIRFLLVDPPSGEKEKRLAPFVKACENRGLMPGLRLDMSAADDQSEWAIRAKKGEKDFQHRFFFFDSWEEARAYDRKARDGSRDCFSWSKEIGKVVMCSSSPSRWDLNYYNPAVFNDRVDQLLALCNQGAELVELGSLSRLWKAPGADCKNLPQSYALNRLIRLSVDIVCPGVTLLGDAEGDEQALLSYLGPWDKPGCHGLTYRGVMDAFLHTMATGDERLLKNSLDFFLSLGKNGAVWLNLNKPHPGDWRLDFDFLRSLGKDQGAHTYYLDEYFSASDRLARGMAAGWAFALTLGGAPLWPDMDELKSWGLSDAALRLNEARNRSAAFHPQADTWLIDTGNDQILGLGRYRDGEQLLALFNFSHENQLVYLLDPREYEDLYEKKPTDCGVVMLPPHGFQWLLHRFS